MKLSKTKDATSPITYVDNDAPYSILFGKAFAQGCDGRCVEDDVILDHDFAFYDAAKQAQAMWAAKENNINFYCGGRSYFNLPEYYSVTKNSMQYIDDAKESSQRFNDLDLVNKDWQEKRGSDILLYPDPDIFYRLWGETRESWVNTAVAELRKYTDRPIRIIHDFYPDIIASAWAVVVCMSTYAVNASLLGVPVFTVQQCAATKLGSSDLSLIETPVMAKDKDQILYNLAANQWTLEEISSGLCWQKLQKEGS